VNPQILFVHTVRCLGCGALDTHSRLFSVDPLATGSGRHLKPATAFYGAQHLEKIAVDPITTPICQHCADAATQPTVTDRESYGRWQAAFAKKKAQDREAAKAERATRKEPSLEDLL
jgi:hypothetical protein